ncbi:MAG: hypothetical protein ACOX7X_08950 [Methanosarcina flavescens]|nr:hypothetical protein [Methanosarcina flavescens]
MRPYSPYLVAFATLDEGERLLPEKIENTIERFLSWIDHVNERFQI